MESTNLTVLPQSKQQVLSVKFAKQKTNLEELSKTLTRLGVSAEIIQLFNDENLREKRRKFFAETEKRQKELVSMERKRKINQYLAASGVPPLFSTSKLTDFKVYSEVENFVPMILDAIKSSQGLYIFGACGTGKTLLSSIIVNEKIQQNCMQALFVSSLDMIHNLNPINHNDAKEVPQLRAMYQTCACLVIDDVGTERPTPFALTVYFDVINYRYNHKLQTIITSNFAMSDLQNYLGATSERIIRRVKTLCKPIQLF